MTLTLHVPEIFQHDLNESPTSFARSTNDERESVSILVTPSPQRRLRGPGLGTGGRGGKAVWQRAAIRIPHPTVANYFTVDLAELKELS
jgi:hypothetical protein